MNIEKKINLNSELIDSICSFFKGAEILFDNDKEIATIYSYLLLQASGIERLQKIYLILQHYDNTGDYIGEESLRKISHKILSVYKSNFEKLTSNEDRKLIEKSLEIVSDIVNNERYTNFSDNIKFFDIPSHITKILELNIIKSDNILDLIKYSWKIINIIIKKYVSILVNDIWHKKVGNGLIIPICLNQYVLSGFKDLCLEKEIEDIYKEEKKSE